MHAREFLLTFFLERKKKYPVPPAPRNYLLLPSLGIEHAARSNNEVFCRETRTVYLYLRSEADLAHYILIFFHAMIWSSHESINLTVIN